MKVCPTCRYPNREGYMFCEDCGEELSLVESVPQSGASPSQNGIAVISLRLPEAGDEILLQLDSRNIIGRADDDRLRQPDIDLNLYQAYEHGVSTLHAVIELTDEGVQIVDIGSTNGTWVNGRRLVPNQLYPLNDDDEIRFGRLVTHIHISSEA
ncbi:MAG TPA: FHA domain-containing protein [Spirillospora sp.]|nr:FHA domain-containing protein [Spirillospora sp.]